MPGLIDHPRFIVVPKTAGYGLMRMFQIAEEPSRPLPHGLRAVEGVLTAIGVQSTQFEPLERVRVRWSYSGSGGCGRRFAPCRPIRPRSADWQCSREERRVVRGRELASGNHRDRSK
jgi:hypothetical protein